MYAHSVATESTRTIVAFLKNSGYPFYLFDSIWSGHRVATTGDNVCFVIMPFGQKPDGDDETIPFDDVYDFIFKPVVEEELGMKCVRADKVASAGWVHADMLGHIFRDEVAIVDLSTLNANVFYELGVRHALRNNVTILLRKKGTKVPFNLSGFRVVEYDLDIKSAAEAKKELAQFIENGRKNKHNDSLVYEVFPTLNPPTE